MNNFSLVDLGKLAEPAKALIEKISEGIGGIAKPAQIRRVAKAEAEASVIAATAQADVDDLLLQRALARQEREQARMQANIESITARAIPLLEDNSKAVEIDNDWIANFFDKSRLVSNDEMQGLWSRILAGEANKPGSFSKKTVNLMADLDKEDAELFSSLCNFQWNGDGDILIFDINAPIYKDNGVNFNAITQLEALGLITTNPQGFVHTVGLAKGLVHYQGRIAEIQFASGSTNNLLPIGVVMLTKAGRELSRLCQQTSVKSYFDHALACWRARRINAAEVSQ